MKPIFVLGCPRSGTTLLLRILSAHGELAWVSKHQNALARRFASLDWLAWFNRIYDLPHIGSRLLCHRDERRLKFALPSPAEPWFFWETHLRNMRWQRQDGQSRPHRRTEDDLTEQEVQQARAAVRRVMGWQGKPRFISKYTDFPRLRYLRKVFPGARFIRIVRDGRAVVNSYYTRMMNGDFHSWLDESERAWWISGWPEEWQEEWQERWQHHPEAALAFTAFKWKYMKKQIQKEMAETSAAECTDVRYAELVAHPRAQVSRLAEFCGLSVDARMKRLLQCTTLENRNDKWRDQLSGAQQDVLAVIVDAN
jgi:hypothetical protein